MKTRYPGNLADELGALQSQIAELRKKEAALKGAIAETGSSVVEGQWYRASVSDVAASSVIDWKAAFNALVPKTRQAFAANYTQQRAGYTAIRVSARSSQAA